MARKIRTTKNSSRRSEYPGRGGILYYGDESVSVAFEEIKAQDWASSVYGPDIKKKWNTLYKKPGYDEKDL